MGRIFRNPSAIEDVSSGIFFNCTIMSRLLIVALFVGCLNGLTAVAQDIKKEAVPGIRIYLDARMNECKRKNAMYFMKVDQVEDGEFLAMVYFMDGTLKMQGFYLDPALETAHGDFTYYYENGNKESEGAFDMGAKIGVWERWNANGTAKAERYYTGYKFGEKPVYDPDVYPEYPGGDPAMQVFLRENLQYPEPARINRVEGDVFVTFVVNKVGQVEQVLVRNSLDPHLDKEAIRVIESMPHWTPGTKDGNLVNTQLGMPIKFRLDEAATSR